MPYSCPIHGTQKIRSGVSTLPHSAGQPYYFCAVSVGVGQPGANAKGFCAAKPVDVGQAAPVAAPPAPEPQKAVQNPQLEMTADRSVFACAALQAAIRLGGTPEEVIVTADRFLHGFLIPAAKGLPPKIGPDADIPF